MGSRPGSKACWSFRHKILDGRQDQNSRWPDRLNRTKKNDSSSGTTLCGLRFVDNHKTTSGYTSVCSKRFPVDNGLPGFDWPDLPLFLGYPPTNSQSPFASCTLGTRVRSHPELIPHQSIPEWGALHFVISYAHQSPNLIGSNQYTRILQGLALLHVAKLYLHSFAFSSYITYSTLTGPETIPLEVCGFKEFEWISLTVFPGGSVPVGCVSDV